jgi:carboxylesterase type B
MFLDIYAPVSAFVHSPSDANLPVIVWFYGGAYISGSKDWGTFNMTAPKTPYEPDAPVPFYDGTAVVQTASSVGSGAIFVTGNYRLGALGWLAGPTITSSSKAKANVGLLDQQLLLQFVTQNIAGFGGNNETITAWGESAGAGSIMHHLIAYGGQKNPPPFTNALLQSAAFEWQWDNRPATGPDHGALDVQFEAFLSAANCNGTGDTAITCLQGLSYEDILRAQANFFEGAGCSGVGPAVDGELILELPATAFENSESLATLQNVH